MGKVKPQYIRLYQETFDQDEVESLIHFYKSPAGQAFVKKMPILTQKTMAMTQSQLQSLLPKVRAAIAGARAEYKPAN